MVEQLIPIGFIVVLIGIILIIIGGIVSATKKDKVGFAFGGFIGPIPFGFATRKELLYLIIAISIILAIVFLILARRGY
ncbi:MAG: DUF131 domain-containing protein [Candidatus Aenigmatarchaeota archaeon]|nr:DUF131 domain-containing protein [Candidatus Aenigmarchaeota archaeon]